MIDFGIREIGTDKQDAEVTQGHRLTLAWPAARRQRRVAIIGVKQVALRETELEKEPVEPSKGKRTGQCQRVGAHLMWSHKTR